MESDKISVFYRDSDRGMDLFNKVEQALQEFLAHTWSHKEESARARIWEAICSWDSETERIHLKFLRRHVPDLEKLLARAASDYAYIKAAKEGTATLVVDSVSTAEFVKQAFVRLCRRESVRSGRLMRQSDEAQHRAMVLLLEEALDRAVQLREIEAPTDDASHIGPLDSISLAGLNLHGGGAAAAAAAGVEAAADTRSIAASSVYSQSGRSVLGRTVASWARPDKPAQVAAKRKPWPVPPAPTPAATAGAAEVKHAESEGEWCSYEDYESSESEVYSESSGEDA